MNVQDVEKELNITRANIRFYEKEGLINPIRKENGYRDYSDEDIAQLKKVIIFRKLNISVGDIKNIFDGNLSLQTALENNLDNLYKQIDEMNGAVEVCKEMQDKKTELKDFQYEHFWNMINNRENNGEKFNDIFKDYFTFEKHLFFSTFFFKYDEYKEKYGVKGIVLMLILICLTSGLTSVFWQNSFWQGFIAPIFIFVVSTLLFAPIYYYGKHNLKIAGIIMFAIFLLMILFFSAIVLLLIYAGINTIIG